MRKFSSYGPIDTDLYYYVPRRALVDQAVDALVGENPQKGGHYITVWAPRQAGKTWVMAQTLKRLQTVPYAEQFDVIALSLERLKMDDSVEHIIQVMANDITERLNLGRLSISNADDFYNIFKKGFLQRPLLLILDEFDALSAEAISTVVGIFRNIYTQGQFQTNVPTEERDYLLHGVALIGVRAVLGIENLSGSPFNIQRGLYVPNLTKDEVIQMFCWYEQESGQQIEQAVIERLFDETQGQPGLVSWFGELLTETYNKHGDTITIEDFEAVYATALNALPNNTVLNIISKAKLPAYKALVLNMFQVGEKIPFRYDDPQTNFLYLNGVIDRDGAGEMQSHLKFACPFVQKRLFNYFAHELFPEVGRLYDPFDNLSDTITETMLYIQPLLRRYEAYLHQNRAWLLKNAPRRADLRFYEAVFHFNLYLYLMNFLRRRGGEVQPEFPTGNGKIDLIIDYAGQRYGLELKSFTDQFGYQQARIQAARYGQQLQLAEIWLIFFVEVVDDANRRKYEVDYTDPATGVSVKPLFVQVDP